MSEQIDISIVVLNYNTSDLLLGALDSIVSTVGDMRIEVVVIDNASTDGGIAHVVSAYQGDQRFSFIQRQNNIGWAAINIMLERARGKYILTLDPDAVLHANALQTLFAFMETHPKAGAATAKFLNPDGSLQPYYRRIMTPLSYFYTTVIGRVIDKYLLGLRHWKRYRYEDLEVVGVVEVEQPALPCMIWRREAVDAYIFDPEIPFYFLDVEMSRRVYDRGYKIYMISDAVITHLKSTSYGRRKKSWQKREYERSLLVYFRKHYPWYLPLIWIEQRTDIFLRACMMFLVGREPLK